MIIDVQDNKKEEIFENLVNGDVFIHEGGLYMVIEAVDHYDDCDYCHNAVDLRKCETVWFDPCDVVEPVKAILQAERGV